MDVEFDIDWTFPPTGSLRDKVRSERALTWTKHQYHSILLEIAGTTRPAPEK